MSVPLTSLCSWGPMNQVFAFVPNTKLCFSNQPVNMASINRDELFPSRTLTILGCGMLPAIAWNICPKTDCPPRHPWFSHPLWPPRKFSRRNSFKSSSKERHSRRHQRPRPLLSHGPQLPKTHPLHRLRPHRRFRRTPPKRTRPLSPTSPSDNPPKRKRPRCPSSLDHPPRLPASRPGILPPRPRALESTAR